MSNHEEPIQIALTRRGLLKGALGGVSAMLLPELALGQTPSPVVPQTLPSRVKFKKVVINENSDFECANAADINGDGKLEIVSGDTWYEGPNWTPHKFREIGVWGRDANNSGYRSDFADLPVDVNGDGKIDIVSSDYTSGEIFWHENLGDSKDLWPKHLIARPGSAETTVFAPILGNKTICILPNCGGNVVWYELRKAGKEPEWVEHVVGKEGAAHGIGFGDVNGDGKIDLISPNGWYEQVDALNDKWLWHPDWHCDPGDLGIGTPTLDIDGDGKNEIIFGSGHHYGIYYLKQSTGGKWEQHPIDTSWSQVHTLMLADLERKGHPVILTGKRYKAHDHDPGAGEPLGLFYYLYDRKTQQWQKFVIDQGTKVGTGLQLTAVDLHHKGRLDVIAPGKSGLYLFENEGLMR